MLSPTTRTSFSSASDAYDYWYWKLFRDGQDFGNTKALFNVGFYITNPKNNYILNKDRKWSQEYAEAEWQWYLSGDPSISKLGEIYGKIPGIWELMADKYGHVNSNYGYQWKRFNQLDKVIEQLKNNKNTRQAAISIYDGSNDIWYGFCNDQYCFSSLQMLVAYETGYELGTYYHFAHNLHLYNDKLPELKTRNYHL